MKVLDLEPGDKVKFIDDGKTYTVSKVVEFFDRGIFVNFLPTDGLFSVRFVENRELEGVLEIIELAN